MNLRQLGDRLKTIAVEVESNAAQAVRDVALTADRVLVLRTPVDTGRARSNWIPTIGAPSSDTREPLEPAALEQEARAVVGEYQAGGPGVFLSNNLPYIRRLNDGHSAQAPAGFVEEALQVAAAEVGRQRLLPSKG